MSSSLKREPDINYTSCAHKVDGLLVAQSDDRQTALVGGAPRLCARFLPTTKTQYAYLQSSPSLPCTVSRAVIFCEPMQASHPRGH